MAKSTRARSKALMNGKRSLDVDVASSFKSSSSEEDNDGDDGLSENGKYQFKSWSSKSKLSPLGADKAKYSFRTNGKNLLADANVGSGMMKLGPGIGRSSDLFSSSEDVKSETRWSKDDEMASSRKGPKCFSRNAVMARLNRVKKKRYVQSLENDFSKLSEENTSLKRSVSDQAATVLNLKKRVRYLESVLANSREISMLLKTVQNSTGLPTMNSLQKISKLSPSTRPTNQLKPTTVLHPAPNGFPPPQRDHIYSKTPDVVDEDFSFTTTATTSEDNVPPTSWPSPILAAEEDFDMDLMAYDTLPFMPANDIPDIGLNLLTPESGDMFDADFSDFGQYFKDHQDDKLLSDVGICLHIAERRVSLEFCETCNSSAVKAWSAQCLRGDAV